MTADPSSSGTGLIVPKAVAKNFLGKAIPTANMAANEGLAALTPDLPDSPQITAF